jgi:hypothetical protein
MLPKCRSVNHYRPIFYGFQYITAREDQERDLFTEKLIEALQRAEEHSKRVRFAVIHSDVYNWKKEVVINASAFRQHDIAQVIVGHNHSYYGTFFIADQEFYQPGAISRNTSATDDLKKDPIITHCRISFDTGERQQQEIPIPVRPASECFNIEYKDLITDMESNKESVRELAHAILSSRNSTVDIKKVTSYLNDLTGDDQELREYIQTRINEEGF